MTRLQAAQQELVAAQGEFLAAWAREDNRPHLIMEASGPDEAREVTALAGEIMALTERAAATRNIAGLALARATAGFWARLAYDFDEPPVVAASGLLMALTPMADLATRLVEQAREPKEPGNG